MKKLDHIKKKAIELRYEGYSLPDICTMLGRSKSTMHHWLKNIPLQRNKMPTKVELMWQANDNKWKGLRKKAYDEGLKIFENRKEDKLFRDFIVVYLTEGHRKSINSVVVTNTNHNMIKACKSVLENFSNKITYRVYFYEDRNPEKIKDFWSKFLTVDKNKINVHLKKGGKLNKRSSTCDNGIMHIRVNDYTLRAKVQAWMDCLEEEWKK